MILLPAFRMGQYRVNDHPYHAPQFTLYSHFLAIACASVGVQAVPNPFTDPCSTNPPMRNCLISLDDYLPDGSPKQPSKTDTFSDTIDETWGRGPIRGPIMIPTDDSKGKSLNQI